MSGFFQFWINYNFPQWACEGRGEDRGFGTSVVADCGWNCRSPVLPMSTFGISVLPVSHVSVFFGRSFKTSVLLTKS